MRFFYLLRLLASLAVAVIGQDQSLKVNQSVLQCTLVNHCLVLFGKSIDLVLFGQS